MDRRSTNLPHSPGSVSYLHRVADNGREVALHFAHANGFNALTYKNILQSLPHSIDAYAMDLRGHGFSKLDADPKQLNSWQIYEQDLLAFVDQLPGPLILAGHSMGGAVSIPVAAARPDKVKALLLIDPVLPPEFTGPLLKLMQFTEIGHAIPMVKSAKRRRKQFASPNEALQNYINKGAFKTWPQQWIENYIEGGTKPTSNGIELTCDPQWEAQNFAHSGNHPWNAIKKLKCPVTILLAEHGSTCPKSSASRFKIYHPSTDSRVIKNTSHFLPMEKPAVVIDVINMISQRIR